MKSPIITIAMSALTAAVMASQSQTPPADSLLVLSKGDLTLSTVDPATLKVTGRVPSGPDPHEVIASSDGRFAYISNYGGGSLNTITVVDLMAQKAMPTIDLGALRGPHGLVFVAGKLWFTAEGAKVIGRYDPATKQIDLVLGTGQNRTHMIDVSKDAGRIVTSNVSSATVTIIEKTVGGRGGGPAGPPQENWDETVIPVGRGAEGFDESSDGKEVWVANAQDGTVSIVDLASKKVGQTLDANVGGANRLKFTPDGKLVFISSLRSPDVAVFDAATRREVKRVKTGRGAAGIQMQPDGSRAYVACTPDDYVAVIDVKSLEIVGRVEAGKQPDGLAWATRR
jgi:YVTN family beta-propeller protein